MTIFSRIRSDQYGVLLPSLSFSLDRVKEALRDFIEDESFFSQYNPFTRDESLSLLHLCFHWKMSWRATLPTSTSSDISSHDPLCYIHKRGPSLFSSYSRSNFYSVSFFPRVTAFWNRLLKGYFHNHSTMITSSSLRSTVFYPNCLHHLQFLHPPNNSI